MTEIIESVKRPFAAYSRNRRMSRFLATMGLSGGERIIDLGGSARTWEACPVPLDLTILNLPGSIPPYEGRTHHTITYVDGDACDVAGFGDDSFDLVFSNSVIEHVGPRPNQEAMAREACRLAPRYWVQTPSIWFPIEAHTDLPFWWFYPAPLKRHFFGRWRRRYPGWADMLEETRVLLHSDIRAMFPDAEVWIERVVGIPKSYVAFRRRRQG